MKALTLTQPWATLIAIGAKRIETRSWQTKYRGPLAIHASASMPESIRYLCVPGPGYSRNAIWDALQAAGVKGPRRTDRRVTTGDLPLGCIVATATLVDVAPIGWPESFRTGVVEGDEGDYPGRPVLVRRQASWDPPIGTLWLDEPKAGVADVSSELPFGDYSAGRWGWLLADVVALPEPIPAKGGRGLWEWNGAS